MSRVATLVAALALCGCANHPAWRAAGIALGVAIVAGHANNNDVTPDGKQQIPGNPCAADPARCK